MPIEFKYNREQNFLTLKIEGKLTIDDIDSTTLMILKSEDYSHDVDTLWDVRNLSFENIDINFIKQIIAARNRYKGKRGNPKIAILSNYMLAAPIIKLYLILSKGLDHKTRAFNTVADAELWLIED